MEKRKRARFVKIFIVVTTALIAYLILAIIVSANHWGW